MNLLRKVFFQLINDKLTEMRQLHDDDSVVLRRKKDGGGEAGGRRKEGLGEGAGGRRLSWSISDLSRLPAVKTSTLMRTSKSRVRNTSISSCSLSSGSLYQRNEFPDENISRVLQPLSPE